MTIDRKEIEALVRIFDQSDWHELRLETDGLRLVLSKDADTAALQPLGDTRLSTAATEPGVQSSRRRPSRTPRAQPPTPLTTMR